MKTCAQCGESVKDNESFCPICGGTDFTLGDAGSSDGADLFDDDIFGDMDFSGGEEEFDEFTQPAPTQVRKPQNNGGQARRQPPIPTNTNRNAPGNGPQRPQNGNMGQGQRPQRPQNNGGMNNGNGNGNNGQRPQRPQSGNMGQQGQRPQRPQNNNGQQRRNNQGMNNNGSMQNGNIDPFINDGNGQYYDDQNGYNNMNNMNGNNGNNMPNNQISNNNTDDSSILKWLGTMFLMIIPIVNIVYMLMGITSKKTAKYKKNYFIAFLIYTVLMCGVSIAVAIFAGDYIVKLL